MPQTVAGTSKQEEKEISNEDPEKISNEEDNDAELLEQL